MDIWITGGGWVSADGWGLMNEGTVPIFSQGVPLLPPARDLFTKPHQRYGRFDTYTKLGCAAVALTLKDANIKDNERSEPIGLVVSTVYEVMETDIAYYETTLQEGGLLSSPNLFSYTLPVSVLGECAVLFKLIGPTFCVGGDDSEGAGISALKSAASIIHSGKTARMIVGWIENPPALASCIGNIVEVGKNVAGAVFVMLEARPKKIVSSRIISYKDNRLIMNQGLDVTSLSDLFGYGELNS